MNRWLIKLIIAKGLNLKYVLILDQDSLNPIEFLSQGILISETAEAC